MSYYLDHTTHLDLHICRKLIVAISKNSSLMQAGPKYRDSDSDSDSGIDSCIDSTYKL